MIRLWRRLAALLLRGPDAPFITQDLEEIYCRDRERGVPESRAARRYGRLVIASFISVLNAARRNMQNALILDLRQAARALARDRGFSIVAIGTLGASLALCVVVAVLLNASLLRGLPYPDSDRLFDVRYGAANEPPPQGIDKLDWQSLDDVLDLSIAWDLDMFTLRGGSAAEFVEGSWITRGYAEGFGVRAGLGRTFQPDDFAAGRPMVAMISDRLWRQRFNGDPAIIGRPIEAFVNDRPNEVETFTVIGVLPADHWHVVAFTEVLAPLRVPAYPYTVRVRAGVPPELAAERITSLVRNGVKVPRENWRAELLSLHGRYVERIRPLLLAVATATGLVLLIACANVAVLLTLRATRRRREMAVRQALGATAGQITRVAIAEPLLIGVAATAVGVTAAWAAIAAMAPRVAHYLGRQTPGGVTALGVEPATFVLAGAVGVMAVAIASFVPVMVTRRTRVSMATSGGQKGATDGPAQRRARTVMIAVEVAACLTLLVGAGLTIQSALGILRVDMGLDADEVLVGRFSLRQRAYPDAAAWSGFHQRLLARGSEIASSQGIALTNTWPLQQSVTRDVGSADTATFPTRAGLSGVSPDYFSVLRVPLHEGRAFTAADRVGTEPVVIVSRTLAARLWGNQGAVGRQLRIAAAPNGSASAAPLVLSVIGVVGDTRHAHTDDDLADVYLPILQRPSPGAFVYIRASDMAGAERDVRRLLSSIDGEVAFGAARPLAEVLDLQRAGARLLASLLMVFAIFAAALALIGIYAVVAYTVKQREREIAVRLAIGADRTRITRMFVAQGAVVLAAGLLLGLGGAIALGRILRSQLFGVQPADPVVLAGMTLAFALCGLAAIAWPSRAAGLVDSVAALKD